MRSRRTTVVLPEELRDCFKLESVGGKVRGTRLHKVHDCDWAGRVIVADNSAEMTDERQIHTALNKRIMITCTRIVDSNVLEELLAVCSSSEGMVSLKSRAWPRRCSCRPLPTRRYSIKV